MAKSEKTGLSVWKGGISGAGNRIFEPYHAPIPNFRSLSKRIVLWKRSLYYIAIQDTFNDDTS